MNYNETFCQAIQVIVDNAIAGIQTDQTIQGTITKVSTTRPNQYEFSWAGATFTACSDNGAYQVGDQVYILLPASMNITPVILSKIPQRDIEKVKVAEPLNSLVEIDRFKLPIEENDTLDFAELNQFSNWYIWKDIQNFSCLGVSANVTSAGFEVADDIEYGLEFQALCAKTQQTWEKAMQAEDFLKYYKSNPGEFFTFAIGNFSSKDFMGNVLKLQGQLQEKILNYENFMQLYICGIRFMPYIKWSKPFNADKHTLLFKDIYIHFGLPDYNFDSKQNSLYLYSNTNSIYKTVPSSSKVWLKALWLRPGPDKISVVKKDDPALVRYNIYWYVQDFSLSDNDFDFNLGYYWKNLSMNQINGTEEGKKILLKVDGNNIIQNDKGYYKETDGHYAPAYQTSYDSNKNYYSYLDDKFELNDIQLNPNDDTVFRCIVIDDSTALNEIIADGRFTFSNVTPQEITGDTIDLIKNVKYKFNDNYSGKYEIYNPKNNMIDEKIEKSSITVSYECIKINKDKYDDADLKVRFTFPDENTMIKLIQPESKADDSESKVEVQVDENVITYTYSNPLAGTSDLGSNALAKTLVQSFSIKQSYLKDCGNNTIKCEIYRQKAGSEGDNDIYSMDTINIPMSFGLRGQMMKTFNFGVQKINNSKDYFFYDAQDDDPNECYLQPYFYNSYGESKPIKGADFNAISVNGKMSVTEQSGENGNDWVKIAPEKTNESNNSNESDLIKFVIVSDGEDSHDEITEGLITYYPINYSRKLKEYKVKNNDTGQVSTELYNNDWNINSSTSGNLSTTLEHTYHPIVQIPSIIWYDSDGKLLTDSQIPLSFYWLNENGEKETPKTLNDSDSDIKIGFDWEIKYYIGGNEYITGSNAIIDSWVPKIVQIGDEYYLQCPAIYNGNANGFPKRIVLSLVRRTNNTDDKPYFSTILKLEIDSYNLYKYNTTETTAMKLKDEVELGSDGKVKYIYEYLFEDIVCKTGECTSEGLFKGLIIGKRITNKYTYNATTESKNLVDSTSTFGIFGYKIGDNGKNILTFKLEQSGDFISEGTINLMSGSTLDGDKFDEQFLPIDCDGDKYKVGSLFEVNKSGALVAENAIVRGSVYANDGKFGDMVNSYLSIEDNTIVGYQRSCSLIRYSKVEGTIVCYEQESELQENELQKNIIFVKLDQTFDDTINQVKITLKNNEVIIIENNGENKEIFKILTNKENNGNYYELTYTDGNIEVTKITNTATLFNKVFILGRSGLEINGNISAQSLVLSNVTGTPTIETYIKGQVDASSANSIDSTRTTLQYAVTATEEDDNIKWKDTYPENFGSSMPFLWQRLVIYYSKDTTAHYQQKVLIAKWSEASTIGDSKFFATTVLEHGITSSTAKEKYDNAETTIGNTNYGEEVEEEGKSVFYYYLWEIYPITTNGETKYTIKLLQQYMPSISATSYTSYLATATKAAPSKDSLSWRSTIQQTNFGPNYEYLWGKLTTTYSDGTTSANTTVQYITNYAQQGQPGSDGTNGKDGKDGVNGADGAPGRDGADGKTSNLIKTQMAYCYFKQGDNRNPPSDSISAFSSNPSNGLYSTGVWYASYPSLQLTDKIYTRMEMEWKKEGESRSFFTATQGVKADYLIAQTQINKNYLPYKIDDSTNEIVIKIPSGNTETETDVRISQKGALVAKNAVIEGTVFAGGGYFGNTNSYLLLTPEGIKGYSLSNSTSVEDEIYELKKVEGYAYKFSCNSLPAKNIKVRFSDDVKSASNIYINTNPIKKQIGNEDLNFNGTISTNNVYTLFYNAPYYYMEPGAAVFVLGTDGLKITGNITATSLNIKNNSNAFVPIDNYISNKTSSIKNISYLYARSQSPTVVPTIGWQGDIPPGAGYIWQKTQTDYTLAGGGSETKYSAPVCITKGADGRSIESSTVYYAIATQKPTAPTVSGNTVNIDTNIWKTSLPTYLSGNNYYYCTVIEYTSGAPSVSSVSQYQGYNELIQQAKSQANSAQSYANAAASSSSAAQGYATSATNSANSATNSANSAQGYASTAQTAANSAQGYASTAQTAAQLAQTTIDNFTNSSLSYDEIGNYYYIKVGDGSTTTQSTFLIDKDGAITATDAIISGKLYTSGIFIGSNQTDSVLYIDNKGITGRYGETVTGFILNNKGLEINTGTIAGFNFDKVNGITSQSFSKDSILHYYKIKGNWDDETIAPLYSTINSITSPDSKYENKRLYLKLSGLPTTVGSKKYYQSAVDIGCSEVWLQVQGKTTYMDTISLKELKDIEDPSGTYIGTLLFEITCKSFSNYKYTYECTQMAVISNYKLSKIEITPEKIVLGDLVLDSSGIINNGQLKLSDWGNISYSTKDYNRYARFGMWDETNKKSSRLTIAYDLNSNAAYDFSDTGTGGTIYMDNNQGSKFTLGYSDNPWKAVYAKTLYTDSISTRLLPLTNSAKVEWFTGATLKALTFIDQYQPGSTIKMGYRYRAEVGKYNFVETGSYLVIAKLMCTSGGLISGSRYALVFGSNPNNFSSSWTGAEGTSTNGYIILQGLFTINIGTTGNQSLWLFSNNNCTGASVYYNLNILKIS